GHRVRGVGEERSIAALNAGRPPVHEPLLATLIRRNIGRGRLRYTADLEEGLRGAGFVYVAFDTPVSASDEAQVEVIHDAARAIGRHLSRPRLLCVSAQVPVGTCEQLGGILREQNPRTASEVVCVPDFLRLGSAVVSAGLGFAGGTLGRDVRALQALGRRTGRATAFMDAVIAVNEARAGLVEGRLRRLYGSLRGLRVGVLGLTYKAGTSTLRRSAAVEIIKRLVAGGAAVAAFDPLARLDEGLDLPPFDRRPDPYAAARGADAVVLVTEWAGIRGVNLRRLRAAMGRPVMIDTRNFFDPGEMERLGFTYFGVGRSGGGIRG